MKKAPFIIDLIDKNTYNQNREIKRGAAFMLGIVVFFGFLMLTVLLLAFTLEKEDRRRSALWISDEDESSR